MTISDKVFVACALGVSGWFFVMSVRVIRARRRLAALRTLHESVGR